MQLRFEPLLQIQRDLYGLPRGMERFQSYLRTMLDAETGDIRLPLPAMNPMGKDHVPALIDYLLSLDADGAAARAVAEAAPLLASEPGDFRVALVVCDDLLGGWTNRWFAEFSHRFEGMPMYKRKWVVALLWTSEAPSLPSLREEVLTAVLRAAYVQKHGQARSLRDRMAQEGWAMARAGCEGPSLPEEELETVRAVLEPLLGETDTSTSIECLFGDEAAQALGLTARGLPPRAGFALALHDARVAK